MPARDARRLGSAIISHTCARTRQLKLESYNRLFPNQDTLPKGGFGNLIALPLQKEAREKCFSIFVDDALQPHPDQWSFLASVRTMPLADLESAIQNATGGAHQLDVAFITEEDEREPWKRQPLPKKVAGPLPDKLAAVPAFPHTSLLLTADVASQKIGLAFANLRCSGLLLDCMQY